MDWHEIEIWLEIECEKIFEENNLIKWNKIKKLINEII